MLEGRTRAVNAVAVWRLEREPQDCAAVGEVGNQVGARALGPGS